MGERAHSELSPSGSHRWMHCPGSVDAERGRPDEQSPYAAEGTTAHALAEMAFQRNRPCSSWVGEKVDGIVVDGEMAEYVQGYVDLLREYADGAEIVEIESPLTLDIFRPAKPMYGTCDAWFWYPALGLLRIVDLKYGQGVVVEARDNPQLRYYALMAFAKLASLGRAKALAVREVEVVVCQPRAFHPDGPIRTDRFTNKDLGLFKNDLLLAALKTTQPNPPRVAGDWCGFCKARAECPAFRGKALAVAQVEFADVVDGEFTPPDPASLTSAELGAILDGLDVLEAWSRTIRAYALQNIEAGNPVADGWAIKPKRANRQWADEEKVWPYARRHGAKKAELYDVKLKSPAQVEKLLKGLGVELPEDMTVRPSSGYTLCPDTDPKALSPEPEFQVLDDPDKKETTA